MPLLYMQFNQTAVEISAWMINYIILVYMVIITYPCYDTDTDTDTDT